MVLPFAKGRHLSSNGNNRCLEAESLHLKWANTFREHGRKPEVYNAARAIWLESFDLFLGNNDKSSLVVTLFGCCKASGAIECIQASFAWCVFLPVFPSFFLSFKNSVFLSSFLSSFLTSFFQEFCLSFFLHFFYFPSFFHSIFPFAFRSFFLFLTFLCFNPSVCLSLLSIILSPSFLRNPVQRWIWFRPCSVPHFRFKWKKMPVTCKDGLVLVTSPRQKVRLTGHHYINRKTV